MKDKALKLALEFLEKLGENHWGNRPDVIATIKEALAQRTWVGLTGVEINHIFAANVGYPERMMDEVAKLLKEKNT